MYNLTAKLANNFIYLPIELVMDAKKTNIINKLNSLLNHQVTLIAENIVSDERFFRPNGWN